MCQYQCLVTSDTRITDQLYHHSEPRSARLQIFDQYQYDLQCPYVLKPFLRRECVILFMVPHNYQASATNLKPSRYVILAKIWHSRPFSSPGRHHPSGRATRCECHVKGKFLAGQIPTAWCSRQRTFLPSDQTLRVYISPSFQSPGMIRPLRNDAPPYTVLSESPCTAPPVLFGVPGPD